MAGTPEIIVRKATLEDYQGVVDINRNVYHGADYVNFYYGDLITDSDASYYVCLVDGEVGAFEGVSLMDDNNTLMARSARVKDKFQGQGLLQHIRKKIHEDYKDVPGQKRIRTCCTNLVRLVDSKRFRSQNKTLAMKTLFAFDFLDKFSIPAPYCDNIPEVSEFAVDDLSRILENKELVNYLFPEGFVSIMSWFYDPLTSNISHMKKLHPYISMSTALRESIPRLEPPGKSRQQAQSEEASGDKDGHSEDSREARSPQGMMLISGYYFSPVVLHFVIDIYGEPRAGKEEEDIRRIVFHCLKHVAQVMSQSDLKVPVMLGYSSKYGTNTDVYHKILAPLGFTRDGPTSQYTEHYYFEQSFDQLLTS